MRPTAHAPVSNVDGLVAAAALVGVVALACAPSFRGAWVYDDWAAIVQNPAIRHLGSALRPAADAGTPVAGRPLLALSFAIDFAMSGTAPWSYHLTNTLLQVVATLALFGVAQRTLARMQRTAGDATLLAAVIALTWAVHPLQTEAVTYVAQRAESLMGCCYLATLYAFVRASGASRPGRWLALSVAVCALGMAAKEVMVSAPLVVALYDRTFISGTFAAAWRRHRGYYFGLAATWLLLGLLVATDPTRGGTAGFSGAATWWSYGAVQLRAFILYLKLALWPNPLVFDYGIDWLPFGGGTIACAVGVSGFALATLFAVRRRAAAGFLGAAVILILAPTTSVLPIVTEPIAEQRMYLPLGAVVALWVVLAWRLLGRRIAGVALACIAALVALTVRRDRDYRSETALWTDTVAKAPANARAHYNLGRLLAQSGDLAGARREYDVALAMRPDLPSARTNLSDVLLLRGDVHGAEEQAREAVRLAPNLAEAHNNLANALLVGGDAGGAAIEYERAVRLEPRNPDLRNNLATAFTDLNRLPEAAREYETALRLNPDSALLHFNLGNTYARLAQFDAAVREYEAALRLDPHVERARENLVRVHALQARASFNRIQNARSPDSEGH